MADVALKSGMLLQSRRQEISLYRLPKSRDVLTYIGRASSKASILAVSGSQDTSMWANILHLESGPRPRVQGDTCARAKARRREKFWRRP